MNLNRIGNWMPWLCLVHCLGITLFSIAVSGMPHPEAHAPWLHELEGILVALAGANGARVAWHLRMTPEWRIGLAVLIASAAAPTAFFLEQEWVMILALVGIALLQVHIERCGLCPHHHYPAQHEL